MLFVNLFVEFHHTCVNNLTIKFVQLSTGSIFFIYFVAECYFPNVIVVIKFVIEDFHHEISLSNDEVICFHSWVFSSLFYIKKVTYNLRSSKFFSKLRYLYLIKVSYFYTTCTLGCCWFYFLKITIYYLNLTISLVFYWYRLYSCL